MTALVANPIIDDAAKSPQVYSFIRRISDNFPSRHFKSIFNSTRHPQANTPCLVTNNNYSLEDNSQPSFTHSNSSADTHIFHRLNVEPLSYLQEEHELLKRCYQSLPDLSFNSEYKNHFQSTAGQELISTQGRGVYIAFLNEFKKILAKNYGKRIEFTDREIDSQLDLINLMDSENDLIEFDLVNNSAVQLICTLENILDNITNEETNYFCLTSHSFVHPITSLLSPAALAISFFNSKLLKLVKPRPTETPFYYTKQNLPRVTYINFTGIYSEIDIDTLHGFSENIQTITIYDERTGGPLSILTPGLHKEQDFRTHRQAFTAISDLLLLIPLKCDLEKGGKVYRPNDIFEIFETIVLRSVSKFKPSYIVLNCSLTFGDDNQTPFAMDQETFEKIVSLLNQLSDCKVIVYPFKLPNAKNPEINKMLERSKMHLNSEAQKVRYQGILDRFAVPYDDYYFHSCFVSMIESLANLKNKHLMTKDKIRNKYPPSPLKSEMLYKLGRFYKNHTYYNFLHTKSYGVFAQIVKDHIQPAIYSETTPYNLDNKLPLIYSDNSIGMATLGYQEGDKNEIILDVNTQYFVDYERFTEPTIYIFNAKARASSLNNLLQTVTPLSHFVISFDKDPVFNSQFEPLLFDKFEIEGLEGIPQVKDFGMCKCKSFVFQVYGTYIERKLDTTDICYFDFGSKKPYKIQITNSHGEILPRHSVTSCAFKKKDRYYLYIFGGQVHPNTKYNNKSLGTLDIIDIVEVYTTKDPTSSQWEYQILAKDKLFANKQDSFIPFRQSYAYYSHEADKIFLMGGTILPNSVVDWTFPVFEFDVEANQFTAFTTFLNERKDNMFMEPSRELRDSRPIAIADRNKNFWYDQKNEKFLFLLPSRDYKNSFNLYSYHPVSKTCKFETVKIEKTQEKEKDSRVPVLPVKDVKTLLSVKESIEIGYKFSSSLEKKVLLEFVQWRIQLEEPTIELTVLQNWINNAQEVLRTELSKLNEESSDKLKFKEINEKQNKYEAYENLRSLIEDKITQNTFINLDNKLIVLERFLKSRISEANPEKELAMQSGVSFIESGEVDLSLSSYKIKGYQSFDKDRNTVFLKNPNGDVSVLASDPKIIEDKFKQNHTQKVLTDLSDNHKFDKIEEKVSEISLSSKDMAELSSGYIQILKNDNTLVPRMDESFLVLDTSHANVVEFKNCISAPSTYQVFLSALKNALTIIVTDKKGQVQQKTLRFRIVSEEVELEEISFYLSPSSITFYNGALICYIDQEFKRSHPHLYEEYKNWVLYANVEQIVSSMQLGGSHPKHLVFKKLFALTADESIFNRCLLLNQESLFLFGGKSIRYKGKKSAIYHNLVSKYDLFKLKEVTLQTSFMRDNDTEEMQNNCGECVAVSTGKYIYVCQKENAKEIDIYKANGTHEESIQFDFSTKGWNIHLNLVNIREREEILITLYTQDKDMKFVLLDVKKKTFEEKVLLVPKNTEENILSPVLYSGYEVLSHNINTQPIKEIQMCHIRGDKPQVVVYDIQVGN